MTQDLANNPAQRQEAFSPSNIPLGVLANAALARLNEVVESLAAPSSLSIGQDAEGELGNAQLRMDAAAARSAIFAGIGASTAPVLSRAGSPGASLVFGGLAMATLVARKAVRVKDKQEREIPMKKARAVAIAMKARRSRKSRHGSHASDDHELDDSSSPRISAFSGLPSYAPAGLSELGLDGELSKELALALGDLRSPAPEPHAPASAPSGLAMAPELSVDKIFSRRSEPEPKPYDLTTSPFYLKMPKLEFEPRG